MVEPVPPSVNHPESSPHAGRDSHAPAGLGPVAGGRRTALAPWVLLSVGIVAAFGPGKLPPVLPALQGQIGLTLLEAGWLVAVFQVAAALLGVFGGALADRYGPRRVMQTGLLIGALSAACGALSPGPLVLFASRIGESLGFILAVLPAAALFRRCLPAERLTRWLGAWGTYMPTGMALALLASPWAAAAFGWRGVWWAHAACLVVCLGALRVWVERDDPRAASTARFAPLVRETLTVPGPWLLAAAFGVYAGQYLTIVSFLPSAYQAAGIAMTSAGALTALVAGINLLGNLTAGVLAQRGWPAGRVITIAAVALVIGPWLAFAGEGGFVWRYVLICTVSMVAGVIPGTLFTLAPRFAPRTGAVSATVGLMQQGSGLGQVVLPPLVAAVAMSAGGWQYTGAVTGGFGLVTMLIGLAIGRHATRLQRAAV